MHPGTHLQLHTIRSAELRRHAADFRLSHPRPGIDTDARAPRTGLRTRLGLTMVEFGLRLLPDGSAAPARPARTA
ncbi:hypothetical protein [Streptomyces sp. ITFR-6]|uniref:hypothetical protein n=1 Tax=Streptomyces sp. ITFR-6 TaxID=3075197 RepID=UPI00288C0D83|nr:hypothetical protein [Streptomyces sp. ITFR-6]WNI31645.1 hypothetical protein RLT59_24780 [Streptomyces sp. ITFR-6]